MKTKINCNECNNVVCLIKQYGLHIWMDKIEPNKIQIEYKAGDYLFREGDIVYGICFIQHGKVKILSTDINNKDRTVCIAGNGHILGHPGYGKEKYPISARVLSDSMVCFIDNDSFYDICISDPQFTIGMTMFYYRELQKAEIKLKYIISSSPVNKKSRE